MKLQRIGSVKGLRWNDHGNRSLIHAAVSNEHPFGIGQRRGAVTDMILDLAIREPEDKDTYASTQRVESKTVFPRSLEDRYTSKSFVKALRIRRIITRTCIQRGEPMASQQSSVVS